LEKRFNIAETSIEGGNCIVNIHTKNVRQRKHTCITDYPSYILCLVLQQEHQQPYLNVFLRWGIVLTTTMTLISNSYDEDKVFYNYCLEDLTLSQTFLFSLWSFLVFAHSFVCLLSNFANFTNLHLFMACRIIEQISKSKSPKTYISWVFFNLIIHWPWLETSKNIKTCRT